MGQCVSRGQPGPFAFARHYDVDSLASSSSVRPRGHSESKGAKKRDKSAGNGNKQSRGVATSFGFRRRPASSSRADDNARRKGQQDNNGHGGSSEDLRAEEVFSGRSTPLARPRKEAAGQPLRTNRFGCRQPASKTAKVGDVGGTAEPAFGYRDDTTFSNNNTQHLEKKNTNAQYNLMASQATTTIVGAAGLPKTYAKQTVILTYQPQQYSIQQDVRPKYGNVTRYDQPRAPSVTRQESRPPGKYTFHTNQLPRPQYPSVKHIDQTKNAKQVVNNTRKAGVSDGWREGAGSAVSCDSGVWTGAEGEGSPRMRRRPRNLEMVMKGTHTFHLRELHDSDLDIMDEAVVTGHSVIPLPKLPSTFDDPSPIPEAPLSPVPMYQQPTPIGPKPTPAESRRSSPMSTLDRYRTRTRSNRIMTSLDYKDEEKFVLDRAQPELLNKQNSFIKSSSAVTSPPTVDSSKESSPSCKSEGSHFGNNSVWQTHAAGEAMANRSQDDVSIALSVSSCEDDRSKLDNKESYHSHTVETENGGYTVEVPKEEHQGQGPNVPQKMIVILDDPPVPHPLLMKSFTLSQHATMLGSMTGSNYSSTSTGTNQSDHTITLTLDEPKFDMSALEASTQSLIDDETSPADSLISSTSNSDSNDDVVEREPTVSSSAYQTANTKTGEEGDALQMVKEDHEAAVSREGSKNQSPDSPGTPTHASGELSLSDGRDYFDDEIADQPALLFRKSSEKLDLESTKLLKRSRERMTSSPIVQRNRKLLGQKGTERTPSLDTLSSLASDDLMMMDNDMAQSVTSLQSIDDYIERLDSSLRGLNTLDEKQLRQELSSSSAIRQWSQLLEQNTALDQQLAAMGQSQSLATSTSSLTNVGLGATLPVRTARLLQRSRAPTPADGRDGNGRDGNGRDNSASPAPATLLQDVVDIKTLLLQLKRVLQEPEEEHHSMSSETLDPLARRAESPPRANGRHPPALQSPPANEMRRQILYLQSQLEERDRLVRVLQQQMLRLEPEPRSDDTCTRATQTERLRPPMTTNTGLASSDNSGLVSWNEQVSGRKLPLYSEAQKTRRSVGQLNGTVKACQCGGRKPNAVNDEQEKPVTIRTTSRVGSKYLQALHASNDNRRYVKRDSSVGEPERSKTTLYSTRSHSIENFQNHPYTINEPVFAKNTVKQETTVIKHHTSYGDLYNGRISSKESVNGNRLSPLNSQSTDTDYSSDGGYKSLPSSINYNGHGQSPKRVSGIPKRSVERKFVTTKQVRASAV